MKTKRCFIIISIIISVFLTSCGSMQNMFEEKANKHSEVVNINSSGEQSLLNEKYASYVELELFIKGKLQESLEFYFQRFGHGKEIEIKKNSNLQPGVFLQVNKNELKNGFEFSKKNPCLDKIDSSVEELYPKLEKFIDYLRDADSYYKLKSYVDDDFAKGKELHKNICSQYNEVKPCIDKFVSQINVLFDKKSKEDLAEFKNKDFMIRYYALSCILKAKDLEHELDRQKITFKNTVDLDIAKFKEKYNLLADDTNKFIEYIGDDDRVSKENLKLIFSKGNLIKSRIMNVKADATDILTRAKKEKANDSDLPEDRFKSKDEYGSPENYKESLRCAIYEYIQIK